MEFRDNLLGLWIVISFCWVFARLFDLKNMGLRRCLGSNMLILMLLVYFLLLMIYVVIIRFWLFVGVCLIKVVGLVLCFHVILSSFLNSGGLMLVIIFFIQILGIHWNWVNLARLDWNKGIEFWMVSMALVSGLLV